MRPEESPHWPAPDRRDDARPDPTARQRAAVAAVQRAGELLGDALDSRSQALIDMAIERAVGAIDSAAVLLTQDRGA